MPLTEGQTASFNDEFMPAALVPADRVRHYDTYMGGISATPCTENVRWFLLADTMTLSPGQIATFAKLWPDNTRRLQPVNGRAVQRSRRARGLQPRLGDVSKLSGQTDMPR
ncbi:MAG: carbonic anhydrase family protein [Sphingomonas sp.]